MISHKSSHIVFILVELTSQKLLYWVASSQEHLIGLPESSKVYLGCMANIQYGMVLISLFRTSRTRKIWSDELDEYEVGKNWDDRNISNEDILLLEMLR